MNLIKVKYEHPAYPLHGISLGVVYVVDVEKDVVIEGVKFELELFKTLFTPIDKSWEEVFKKKELLKEI